MSSATVRTIWTVLACAPSTGAATIGGGSVSPLTSRQRMTKWLATSATAGPSRRVPTSCQPSLRRAWVVGAVEAIAGLVGHVDAVDERDLVVDDDGLLVVAVDRVLARVAVGLDVGVARQLLHLGLDLLARGVKERDRRAGPHHHADVDALGQLGQQRADRDRALAADELEVRREVPAGDVHVRAGGAQGLGHRGQRGRAIDQDLQLAARPRRRVAGGKERRARAADPARRHGRAAAGGGDGGA